MRIGASVIVMAMCVTACSGGGGSSPTPTPTPTTTIAATISPESQAATATENNSEASFSFEATRTGSAPGAVVADVQYDSKILMLDGLITQTGNVYKASFKSAKGLGGGKFTGKVTFRLCQETACANVYPNTTREFSYTLDVPLDDWVTQQRNASHNGYVHATLNAASFKKAWEWNAQFTERLSTAATKADSLFVTRHDVDGTVAVHALSTADGSARWSYSFGRIHYGASSPAVSGNQVYVATMVTSSGNNKIEVIDSASGRYLRSMEFASQWSNFSPPTPYGSDVHFASGYYGGVAYNFVAETGNLRWTTNGGGYSIWDGMTPAVDDKYVYFYGGETLDVFDRATGAQVKRTTNPHFVWGGYSYYGGPILGANGNLVVYAGSGTGGIQQWSHPLLSFAAVQGTVNWKSQDAYVTTPALANGVIYVARNGPQRLDALNETTGAVLWSWNPPSSLEKFIGNLVATDNMVFASTDQKLYAISIGNGAPAILWEADTPGLISVSSDFKLLVAVRGPNLAPTSRLVAYSLR